MHLDLTNEQELQSWLVTTLEPICDADPNTLAEYIIAVLKNEISDVSGMDALHVFMEEQLKEFIQETPKFVSRLLSTVQNKSYIARSGPAGPSRLKVPSAPSSRLSTRQSTPGEPHSQPRSRKRSLESTDEADVDAARRSTRQRMDIDQDVSTAAPSSYHIETFDQTGHGPRRPNMMGGYGHRPPGQSGGAPVKICFDFFNKGHCRRGDSCKYSHGSNPIVGGNMPFLPNGMMNPAAFPMGMMMPPDLAMSFMMGQGMGAFDGGGRGGRRNNLDRDADMVDMTPDQQPMPVVAGPNEQPSDAMVGVEMDGAPPGVGSSGLNGASNSSHSMANGAPMRNGVASHSGAEGAARRRPGLSRYAGVTTIVVDKIPPANLSDQSVTEWFQRFGTISKVLLDRRGKQALVTFSDHKEANAAIRSQDAPWGNKFAKVFWHNPIYGGAAGAKAIANEPAPFDKTTTAKPSSSVVFNASSKPSTSGVLSTAAPSTDSITASRRSKLDEQKKLLEEASTATPERKKEIIVKLRELDKALSKPISAELASATVAPASSSITPTDPAAAERDRLDQELDVHSGTNATEGSGDDANSGNSNYEALKARLASLRAEASSLGIDPMDPDAGVQPSPPPHASSSFRGFTPRGRGRGRARGRGSFFAPRGRGGGPGAGFRGGGPNMKLDLRPKKLLVKLGTAAAEPEKIDSVKQWFQAIGDVDNISTTGPAGDVVVLFKSRADAEMALSKGTVIPGAGPVTVAWQVDNAPPGSSDTGPGVGGSMENLDEDTEMPNQATDGNVEVGGNGKVPADSGPDNYHVAENYETGDDPDAAW